MKLVALTLTMLFAVVATAATNTAGTTSKKFESGPGMSAPQVLETGDNLIGARAYQGEVFDNNPLISLNYERMVAPNFGVGGLFGYSTYEKTIRVGTLKGTYEYDAYVIGALGSFHFDLFKVKNLDTFLTGGVGRTIIKSKWSSRNGLAQNTEADSSSTYLLGYATARYFVNPQWAFSGSLGINLGTLALGMDYLF
jgi:hypothetical protein